MGIDTYIYNSVGVLINACELPSEVSVKFQEYLDNQWQDEQTAEHWNYITYINCEDFTKSQLVLWLNPPGNLFAGTRGVPLMYGKQGKYDEFAMCLDTTFTPLDQRRLKAKLRSMKLDKFAELLQYTQACHGGRWLVKSVSW
jgi:hypothetical protein